jgi:hypothetical protein
MIAAIVEHSDLMTIDWTAVILALIAAWSATYAGWVSRQNAKALKETKQLLKTNSGKTIGEHIEHLEGELAHIAQEKVAADAQLAAAALVAVARLAVATEPPPMSKQAEAAAQDLLTDAEETAALLGEGNLPKRSAPEVG